MKIRVLGIALMLAVSSLVGVMAVPAQDVIAAKVKCPAGSRRGKGVEVDTYADCNILDTDVNNDVPSTAQTIINVMVSVVGIIAVAVIVIGGILFVTSAGDANKAKRAQHTILYGVVGLVIALLAFAIVNFVLKSVFS